MKIWEVSSGEDDDWGVEERFTNKESAEQYMEYLKEKYKEQGRIHFSESLDIDCKEVFESFEEAKTYLEGNSI